MGMKREKHNKTPGFYGFLPLPARPHARSTPPPARYFFIHDTSLRLARVYGLFSLVFWKPADLSLNWRYTDTNLTGSMVSPKLGKSWGNHRAIHRRGFGLRGRPVGAGLKLSRSRLSMIHARPTRCAFNRCSAISARTRRSDTPRRSAACAVLSSAMRGVSRARAILSKPYRYRIPLSVYFWSNGNATEGAAV